MVDKMLLDELKNLHRDIKEIKNEIKELKEIILPTERISEEKLKELKKLENDKMEAFVEWKEDLDVF